MPVTDGSFEEVAEHTGNGSKSGSALSSKEEDRRIAEAEAQVRKSRGTRLRERG